MDIHREFIAYKGTRRTRQQPTFKPSTPYPENCILAMAVFQWPSMQEPSAVFFLVSSAVLLSYLAYTRFCLERTRRAFKLEHGCQPLTAKQSGRGPFGIRDMHQLINAKNEHRLLEFYHQRHAEIGSTYFSGGTFYTNDRENIKCALATRFADWYVPRWAHTNQDSS